MRLGALFTVASVAMAQARNPAPLGQPGVARLNGYEAEDQLDSQDDVFEHMAHYSRQLETHLHRQDRHRRLAARASGQPYTPLYAQNDMCMDVKDNALWNGGGIQVWQCSGSANQQWRIEGPLLQTSDNLCLDVPGGNGYNGAHLQVWTCDGNNANQHWEQVGGNLRWYGHNYCVDVTGGNFNNGNLLQLWNCYYGSPNQAFTFGQPVQAVTPTTTSGGSFLGYAMIDWGSFLNLHPVLSSYAPAFPQAAATYNLVPQLLAAIALQESGGNCAPSNGAGLMQFTDWNTWQAYGNGGSRDNCYDAIWAGARYMRALLDENGQNLDTALRAYNGPVGQGGVATYQDDIRQWMQGVYVYGPGI